MSGQMGFFGNKSLFVIYHLAVGISTFLDWCAWHHARRGRVAKNHFHTVPYVHTRTGNRALNGYAYIHIYWHYPILRRLFISFFKWGVFEKRGNCNTTGIKKLSNLSYQNITHSKMKSLRILNVSSTEDLRTDNEISTKEESFSMFKPKKERIDFLSLRRYTTTDMNGVLY